MIWPSSRTHRKKTILDTQRLENLRGNSLWCFNQAFSGGFPMNQWLPVTGEDFMHSICASAPPWSHLPWPLWRRMRWMNCLGRRTRRTAVGMFATESAERLFLRHEKVGWLTINRIQHQPTKLWSDILTISLLGCAWCISLLLLLEWELPSQSCGRVNNKCITCCHQAGSLESELTKIKASKYGRCWQQNGWVVQMFTKLCQRSSVYFETIYPNI